MVENLPTVKKLFDLFTRDNHNQANHITVKRLLNLMDLPVDKLDLSKHDVYNYEQFKSFLTDLLTGTSISNLHLTDKVKRVDFESDTYKEVHNKIDVDSMAYVLNTLFEDTSKSKKIDLDVLEKRFKNLNLFSM